MAQQLIGARDRIDQLLVQKYADTRVNNTNTPNIPVERIWQLMTNIARYEQAIRDVKVNKAS